MGMFKIRIRESADSYKDGRKLESGSKGYDGIKGATEGKSKDEEEKDDILAAISCIPEDANDDIVDLKEDTNDGEKEDFGHIARRLANDPTITPRDINSAESVMGKALENPDFDFDDYFVDLKDPDDFDR